jgi:hypothetical protein
MLQMPVLPPVPVLQQRTICVFVCEHVRRRPAEAHPNLDTTVRKTSTSASHRIVYGAGAWRVGVSLRTTLLYVSSNPTASTESGKKFGPADRTNLHISDVQALARVYTNQRRISAATLLNYNTKKEVLGRVDCYIAAGPRQHSDSWFRVPRTS